MRLFSRFRKKNKSTPKRPISKEKEFINALSSDQFKAFVSSIQSADDRTLRELSNNMDMYSLENAINERIENEQYMDIVLNTNDEKVLRDIAMAVERNDEIACLAVEKINNKQYLFDIIKNKKLTVNTSRVNNLALDKLKEKGCLMEALQKVAKGHPDYEVRDYILDNLEQSEIVKIAKTDSNASFAGGAASRITNKSDLRDVFKNAKQDEARARALSRLNDSGLCNKIVREGPGKWGHETVAAAIWKSNNVTELRKYKLAHNPERSAAIGRLKELGKL